MTEAWQESQVPPAPLIGKLVMVLVRALRESNDETFCGAILDALGMLGPAVGKWATLQMMISTSNQNPHLAQALARIAPSKGPLAPQ